VEDACDANAGIGAPARRNGARSDGDVDGAYRELRASVARGLAQRLGSSDLADDLTQDVFVDLLLAARSRPPANTRAWLERVAQRHAADTIGSAVRERAARARLAADRSAPAGDLDDPDSRLALDECLARLPESQQRSIELRLLDGLSFARCGLRLGLSEDAARMRFRRALQALRRELVRAGLGAGW
jgi:RNA polymerase sigma factor (sigma-70 family)